MPLLFCNKTPSTWQFALIKRMQHNKTPSTWHLSLMERMQHDQGVCSHFVQIEVQNEVPSSSGHHLS